MQQETSLRRQVAELWQHLQQLQITQRELEVAASRSELELDRARGEYELEIKTDLGDAMVNTSQVRYERAKNEFEQALAWIAANAGRYRLDPDRINAWGYSSGAHLAALVASRGDAGVNGTSKDGLPRVRAVVAGGIPSDLRKYPDSTIITRFIGGGAEMASTWTDASPISHVSPDDPPVFLYHGKLDMMVGADQATDYYSALRDGGVDAELYLHNWYGHFAMFLLGGGAEDRAIAFLDRNNSRLSTADLR